MYAYFGLTDYLFEFVIYKNKRYLENKRYLI
ncbi:MAG: hypothetical protein QG561_788 [Patescibacteria group bacterium]|jgi:hypothetical protein|nr:hypothetical protein [Patescibacteria group bacterium]